MAFVLVRIGVEVIFFTADCLKTFLEASLAVRIEHLPVMFVQAVPEPAVIRKQIKCPVNGFDADCGLVLLMAVLGLCPEVVFTAVYSLPSAF